MVFVVNADFFDCVVLCYIIFAVKKQYVEMLLFQVSAQQKGFITECRYLIF